MIIYTAAFFIVCLNWVKILNGSDYLKLSLIFVCRQSCWTVAMRSAVSVFYLVILQILWIFRTLYETIIPDNKEKNVNPDKLKPTLHNPQSPENERRHLIHLSTTRPNENNGRPVCYMHVCEILTPHEEEMLRCVCAKGASGTRTSQWQNNNMPPDAKISRAAFTNAWMESFSLVI